MLKNLIFNIIEHYGNIGIILGLLLEFIGLPIPGETLMMFLGYVNWKEYGSFKFSSLAASIAGTFLGSMLAWYIGHKYGEKVLLKYGRYIHITKEKLTTTSKSFENHKSGLLLFGRYMPGVRHIVPYLGGISKIKPGTYIVYNLVGSILWCVSFISLGYVLGEEWTVAEKLIKAYSLILLLLALFAFIVLKYFNKHKRAIFAVTIPVLLFIKLCEDLIKDELSVFDNTVYKYIFRLIGEDMTDLMRFISYLGSGQVLIIISLISAFLFWKNKKYSFYGKMIAFNLIISSVLNETFKQIFHRERPDILRLVEIGGFSFPSGHSMVSISFYGFIAYLFCKYMISRWKYFIVTMLSVLIISIGISRIYLGVHYASDVLAGFSAGLAWLAVFIPLVKKSHITIREHFSQI